MKKIIITLVLISIPFFSNHSREDLSFYQKVFPTLSRIDEANIPDPINYKPVNTKILIAKDKEGEILGYIREIKTNTGCDSACLPIECTLFYTAQKRFKQLLSETGLTKKDHEDFTPEDYFKLESILIQNPKVFEKVTHPYDMVDGITRATTKEFQESVVPTAAYSSLRINTYNQQTLVELLKLKN